MDMAASTLTTKGQLVIPKAIRDRLKLEPGDRLDFIVQEDGDLVLRPVAVDVRHLKGLLHRPGRPSVSVAEMNRVVRQRRGKRA
jgi:AbrB family looped-hinge helix DNA binding protein